ncbi:MAG: hypothetical protein ACK5JU_03610 [Bacteroidales bacterium]
MKRHSAYTRKEAQTIVDQLISEGYELLGTRGVNVDRFECPLPLESWSGETNAFELERNGESAFVAYWTEE